MARKPVHSDPVAQEYAVCRTIAHSWIPYTVQTDKKHRTHLVTLKCSRCETFKSFTMSFDGRILKRNGYAYPEDYLSKHGRLTDREKADMNLSFLHEIQ